MYCSKCGKELVDTAVICPSCGTPTPLYDQQRQAAKEEPQQAAVQHITIDREADSPRSRSTALMLCIFLGILGGHRFYTGKVGTGVLMVWLGANVLVKVAAALGGWTAYPAATAMAAVFVVFWVADLAMILGGSFCDAQGRRLRS